MVQPVIDLTKKNIDHNAKKNQNFIDMKRELADIHKENSIMQKDIAELKKMNDKVKEAEKS